MSARRGSVDLNADLGEGFPNDAPLLSRVTSTSVCCGAYAGDEAGILQTLRLARVCGVAVGAHPGYPDRDHFGRREQVVTAAHVAALVQDQFHALAGLARQAGVVVGFVKPHGALYNQAQREAEIAEGVLDAVASLGLPVLGQPGSMLARRASKRGVVFISEGFPERGYTPDGRLLPRDAPGAVLHEPAAVAAQAVWLVDLGVQTLCIHGDDPAAVEKADIVGEALAEAGIGLWPFVAPGRLS